MNVFLIGSGGREHALAWKIAQSPLLKTLFAAPGNPGIKDHAEIVDVDINAFCTPWKGETMNDGVWSEASWLDGMNKLG